MILQKTPRKGVTLYEEAESADSRGPEIETAENVRKASDCRFQTFGIF